MSTPTLADVKQPWSSRVNDPAVTHELPHRVVAILALVIFGVLAAWALTSDIPRTGPGIQGDIKGDEATYVAATLSLAFDQDLTFQVHDLERFAGIFHRGPEGIFLKRGKRLHVSTDSHVPFVTVRQVADSRTDRFFFAKALLYPVVAAPFARVFGMNGLLLLHVLLLAAMAVCGYLFLAPQTGNLTAALFTSAFLGASALPAYGVFLAPEFLNIGLVFVAYFLWSRKLVASHARFGGIASDLIAAALLGLVTYSKPTNALLVAPLVLFAWWQRQWLRGMLIGIAFSAAVGAGFGLTLAVTGEWNYQGGDRKTFYGSFPFDGGAPAWERANTASTEGSAAREMLTSPEIVGRFATNLKYFVVGRHFGLIPYFFPGVLAAVLWLLSRSRRDAWRVLTMLAFVGTSLILILFMPYTWSGGGGPIGNRYLLSAYPALFFLIPPLDVVWPAVLAWVGGALFAGKILMNPFTAAKYPYLIAERGPLRRLPVELVMANDLPVMLAQPLRAHITYGQDPGMTLYFLDQNAFPPEPTGIWVAGGRPAQIIVRTHDRLDHVKVTVESPIATRVQLSMGAGARAVTLAPGQSTQVDLPARGERGLDSYAYLLTVSSSDGFVPHVRTPDSGDYRNLGALIRLQAVLAQD